jgi:hypothetical protein
MVNIFKKIIDFSFEKSKNFPLNPTYPVTVSRTFSTVLEHPRSYEFWRRNSEYGRSPQKPEHASY